MERYGFSLLPDTIESMACVPTFLIAARPKRIPSSVGAKFKPLLFTQGGNTEIPIREHSSTYCAAFLIFPVTDASIEAIKIIG